MDGPAIDPRLRAPSSSDNLNSASSSAHLHHHPHVEVQTGTPASQTSGTSEHSPDPNGGSPLLDAGALAGQGGGFLDPKKPRACEACRGLKVRCDPDPANPEGPCKRCAKAGRNCVVTQPTRKRQKKTDSRVAELEKKIDALTASLQASRGPPAHSPGGYHGSREDVGGGHGGIGEFGRIHNGGLRDWSATPVREPATVARAPPQNAFEADVGKGLYPPPMVMAGQKRKLAETSPAEEDTRTPPSTCGMGREYADIVDRGVITMDKANELFARYTERMVHHLPGVVFPEGTTAAEIRKTKPYLFIAIMAASSSEIPNTQRTIVKEMMQIFAEKVVVVGEKSLELVQAMTISVIWYWPPEHFEELKFYQIVHMAAVMAIDIGLGRKKPGRTRRHIPYTWRDHPFKKHPPPDPCSVESRRTWLTCYFLTTNTSMALHRPNLIRWTPFMTECVEVLENSPDAAPSDKYMCHLVWTHRMAEDVGLQFSMDDPTAVINVTDPRTQYALRGFERDLEKYMGNVPRAMMRPSLKLSFQVLNLYMHEIALQTENSHEDFRPPFNQESMKEAIITSASLTPAHINALSACLTAIDGIFDAFLGMEVSAIRCLPVFNFVRVAYATVVLIKLYFAASSPNSELGKVMDKDNMKVDQYLEALLEKFRATAADDKSRPGAKFLVVLVMIRSWFQKQGQVQARQAGQDKDPKGLAEAQRECPVADTYSGMMSRPAAAAVDTHRPTSTPATTQPQQHPPPPPPDYSANTRLQMLSEIAAANDGTSTPTPSNSTPPVPWFSVGPPHPQPFMYDAPAATNSTEDAPAVTVGGGESSTPDLPQLGLAQQGPWSFVGGSDLDYANLGDGFAQAMDLTLAGLSGSEFGVEDQMRYAMSEPLFNGMLQGNFPPF